MTFDAGALIDPDALVEAVRRVEFDSDTVRLFLAGELVADGSAIDLPRGVARSGFSMTTGVQNIVLAYADGSADLAAAIVSAAENGSEVAVSGRVYSTDDPAHLLMVVENVDAIGP